MIEESNKAQQSKVFPTIHETHGGREPDGLTTDLPGRDDDLHLATPTGNPTSAGPDLLWTVGKFKPERLADGTMEVATIRPRVESSWQETKFLSTGM